MNRATRNEVTIFTDGSCLGNPGPGGYGVVLRYNGHSRELSGGFRNTTNNRMELLAVIEGLSALKRPCVVTLYSDSKYVVDAMTKGWPTRWRARGWRRGRNQLVANSDLWGRLLQLCDKHDVTFHWIRGHSGHPENERCDQLALAAAQDSPLAEDLGYVSEPKDPSLHVTTVAAAPADQEPEHALDWSQRRMSDEDIARHDQRLAQLTPAALEGRPVRFLCPILMREEESVLSRDHITPKSTGGKGTVLQRQDVDSFFGSFVEADFGHGVNIQGLPFSDTITYMLRKRPSSRLKWLVRAPDGDESPVKLRHIDEDRVAVYGKDKMEPGTYELGLSFDLRYPTLLSCLHSVHLGQFQALGYRYANSNAGRHIASLLAEVFQTFHGKKKYDQMDEDLEKLCFTHRNMVRPVMGDLDRLDQRLLQRPFEWFIAAWDRDVLFATIHFLRAGNRWNAVMVYNLEPGTLLLTTALATSQRPLSFATSLGCFLGDRIELGPPGERISWPCGDESSHMRPYPIRRAANDLQRHLEGMPASYTIF